ncbi:Uncharacterised protein [Mycoplasmopsis columboralis]|uniref:DNA (cytosine-5-)-methyltransferase n=1 Tax=Mycoplasmopsis columboralis TaxID=171282 RepID=A0A449B6P6_9BACT|nr:Uncharacterised protein [Mycoplasmopsis columboralis]
MGFSDQDYQKLKPFIKQGILNKECLYRFAGNSIDINPLNSVFQAIVDIERLNKTNKKGSE